MGYVNVSQVSDPSFDWRDDLGRFYSLLQILSLIFFLLYSSYFIIVAYVAFFQLQEMKKSYKFSLFITFVVIALTITLILCEGYSVASNDSKIYVVNLFSYCVCCLYCTIQYLHVLDSIPLLTKCWWAWGPIIPSGKKGTWTYHESILRIRTPRYLSNRYGQFERSNQQ